MVSCAKLFALHYTTYVPLQYKLNRQYGFPGESVCGRVVKRQQKKQKRICGTVEGSGDVLFLFPDTYV